MTYHNHRKEHRENALKNRGWRKSWSQKYSNGAERYWLTKGKYTIDVSIGATQFYPGSNHIDVRSSDWGGSILVGDYPTNLPTIGFTERVVGDIKAMLNRGFEGKRVPYPT